jgi:hypothetical protein
MTAAAGNASMTADDNIWYRNFYVWLVIFLPFCAVVASFVTLYIAASNPPELAIADYESIQQISADQVARDNRATELGLAAELRTAADIDNSGQTNVELHMVAGTPGMVWPDEVMLRVVHSTLGALDTQAMLTGHSGQYSGQLSLPSGAYDLHIEDAGRSWRLSKRVSGMPARIEFEAFAPASATEIMP